MIFRQIMSAFASSAASNLRPIGDLVLKNRNIECNLPIDVDERNVCRAVPHALFARVSPTPIDSPLLLATSPSALQLLGVDAASSSEEDLAAYLSGNVPLPGSVPLSHGYRGHQFGHFSGQLGDGAAILLGDSEGHELQLKGAGKTPFSRQGDGRKVLRSSLREFLCSEHMATLGIPTTRAAALVVSRGTSVVRDPFYSGQISAEPCAVVSRVAPHFFRFGSLQICETDNDNRVGDVEVRDTLLRHLLHTRFPQMLSQTAETHESQPLPPQSSSSVSRQVREEFFAQMCHDTAQLVARWQTVGFVHGVLNTDNMSLEGLTLDYGPYAFLEHFDQDFTPNGSDDSARYSYGRQPQVCRWNLLQLYRALFADEVRGKSKPSNSEISRENWMEICEQSLRAHFDAVYAATVQTLWRRKLALSISTDLTLPLPTFASDSAPNTASSASSVAENGEVEGFKVLGAVRAMEARETQVTQQLLRTMRMTQVDFTDCFQAIALFVSSYCQLLATSHLEVDKESKVEEEVRREVEILSSRLVSRCASPSTVLLLLSRKAQIHRPTVSLGQLRHVAMHLSAQSTHNSETDMMRQELRNETRRWALREGLRPDSLAPTGADPLDAPISATDDFGSTVDAAEEEATGAKDMEWRYLSQLSDTDKRQRDTMLWQRWITTHYLPLLRERLSVLTEEERARLCAQQRAVCPSVTLRMWTMQDVIEEVSAALASSAKPSSRSGNEEESLSKAVRSLRELVRLLASPSPLRSCATSTADTSSSAAATAATNVNELHVSDVFDPQLSSFFFESSTSAPSCAMDITGPNSSSNNNQNQDANSNRELGKEAKTELREWLRFLRRPPEESNELYCTCSS